MTSEKVKFNLTIFDDSYQTCGTFIEDETWAGFCKAYSEKVYSPVAKGFAPGSEESKKLVPLMVPGSFINMGEGANKTKDNFDSVSLGVFDYDDITEEELIELREVLMELGLAHMIHSTWKNGLARLVGKYRLRVIVLLDRAVPKAEWPIVWRAIANLLLVPVDTSCSDPNRGYYMPAAPLGYKPEDMILESYDGKPVCVDKLIARLDPMELRKTVKGEQKQVTTDSLKRFAKKLIRKNLDTGDQLLKMLKGEPFAEANNRDNTIYQMCQDLGKEYPNADTEHLAERFAPSLSNMPGEHPITISEVKDKLERSQSSTIASKNEKKLTEASAWRQYKELTGADIYTREYIEEYLKESKSGASIEAFRSRLIILHKKYYLFFDGRYYPYEKDGVFGAFRDTVLTPASGVWDVRANKSDAAGNDIPMSAQELLNEYGTAATGIRAVYGQKHGYFDERTRTLVEGICPIRPELRPRESKDVDRWMQELCGGEGAALENLRDWMAMAPNQKYRLAMIVLVGSKGIGKTQFARGMAKLWTVDAPSDMSFLFEAFQEDLMDCPLLLADEEFPKDYKGRVPSAKLRAMISSKDHKFNRKGLPRIKVEGHLRFAVAVNSLKHITALSDQNQDKDIEALLVRMLVIKCNTFAKNFWKQQDFVDNDGIAEHALWLQQQRQAQIISDPEAVYGVRNMQTPPEGKTYLLTKKSLGVLEALARFLKNRTGEELGSPPAFVARGGLYVDPQVLQEGWEKLFDLKTRRPSYETVRESVKDLSDEEVTVRNNVGNAVSYFRIKRDTLLNYLSERTRVDQIELAIYSEIHRYLRIPKKLRPKEADVLRREQALKFKEDRAEAEDDEDG